MPGDHRSTVGLLHVARKQLFRTLSPVKTVFSRENTDETLSLKAQRKLAFSPVFCKHTGVQSLRSNIYDLHTVEVLILHL